MLSYTIIIWIWADAILKWWLTIFISRASGIKVKVGIVVKCLLHVADSKDLVFIVQF